MVFALVGPISLPAGGIQRSLTDLNNKSNEIIINSNKYVYFYPEKNSKKLSSISIGTSASILRYWIDSDEKRWIRVEFSKSIFDHNPSLPLKGWMKI